MEEYWCKVFLSLTLIVVGYRIGNDRDLGFGDGIFLTGPSFLFSWVLIGSDRINRRSDTMI